MAAIAAPEGFTGLTPLSEADPELYDLIEKEKVSLHEKAEGYWIAVSLRLQYDFLESIHPRPARSQQCLLKLCIAEPPMAFAGTHRF